MVLEPVPEASSAPVLQMTELHSRWLESGEEAPVEPELRVCDPHHHHWDNPDGRYMREELLRDLSGHRVRTTVFVECGSNYWEKGPVSLRPVGETEFVEGIAQQRLSPDDSGGINAGIVAHANLLLGNDVEEVLEAHRAASPNRFRGIRHSAAWHPSPDVRLSHSNPPPHMLGLEKFREGFRQLRRHDLSFDAWLFHTQLDELYDLARFESDTLIVLNHMGGPLGIGPFAGQRAQVMEDWKPRIRRLAECENVVVKLGGLQMEISGFGWHERPKPPSSVELAEAVRPYYLHCIEEFGAHRCMFESDFPVDRISCSYNVLWNCFKYMTRDFSASERAALFHGTAERIYRV